MILNANKQIKQFKKLDDRLADGITAFAGSMSFVAIHVVWFGLWILYNCGFFGSQYRFDPFPFGLLTLVVSLEAIFLSTFVMISQNRQSRAAEIRSELDYHTNVKAEKEIKLMMAAIARLGERQGITMEDLLHELHAVQTKAPVVQVSRLHRFLTK